MDYFVKKFLDQQKIGNAIANVQKKIKLKPKIKY